MKYTLAVFDMDGTILYTLQDITDGLNYALEKNGLPAVALGKVRSFIGNGIMQEVRCSVPLGTSEEVTLRVFEDFNAYYAEHCSDNTKPYDGICDVLKDLRACGIRTAVVSNKGDYAVQQLMKQYFDGLFDYGVGEKENVRRKPEPDTVYEVLKALDTDVENAVYIGDSEVDIKTAENAGMDCILVDYGYRDRAFLEENGADVIVSSPEELENLLLKHNIDTEPLGMKWYRLLVFIGLFAGAFFNMMQGLRLMSGNLYRMNGYSPETIYGVFPLLRYVNIFYGTALFLIGLFCIHVRQELKDFKEKAPLKYETLLALIIAVQLLSFLSYYFLGKYYKVTFSDSDLLLIAVQSLTGLAVLILSRIYFQKRKQYFIN